MPTTWGDKPNLVADRIIPLLIAQTRPVLIAPRHYKMLEVAYEHTRVKWKKWLRRRNSMNRMSWERFTEQVERTLPLPLPRIVHVF